MDTKEMKKFIGFPRNLVVEYISWSPDGSQIAFTHSKASGLELWVANLAEAKVSRITKTIINASTSSRPFSWVGNNSILLKTIPLDRGAKPKRALIPKGPIIQENTGKTAPVRTYQDLLKDSTDEAFFDYYTISQLLLVNTISKETKKLANPGIYSSLQVSPDCKYILLTKIVRPYSYLVPNTKFPKKVELWDLKKKKLIKEIAHIALAENIPKGFGAVQTGQRSIAWRNDKAACIYWVEAQDGGDPRKEADCRDQLFFLDAPFLKVKPSIKFELRFGGIDWCDDSMAICYEWWWKNRQVIRSFFNPSKAKAGKKIIFNLSWEEKYKAPGNFCTTHNKYGRRIILKRNSKELLLIGDGASPEGNRPFLDKFDINTFQIERLWRCDNTSFEKPLYIINADQTSFLTSRESEKDHPDYYRRNLSKNEVTRITNFKNPFNAIKGVQKKIITYERKDGVKLNGTIYLPANYSSEKDDPLPVLMWAYPKEFKSADAAGQLNNSPHRFVRAYPHAPLFWATQGYAVFDDFSMPIIGEGEEEPNETFVQQLVDGAEAAINALVSMGIADRNRIAVGGHSYGAFMTANLLAHTKLFAAGIARSGAYNRTLTPFGFQSEERTLWEAPDTYARMSPFMAADKIDSPLLLIHGNSDNNSGTYPMQSERFYSALKGHGATVRLVLLPHESHGYRAKESILHMLWEMHEWLEKYVKNRTLVPNEEQLINE